jgi:hypothetical protein
MKTLLRASALTFVLALTALTAGKAVSTTGTCHTTCRNNAGQIAGSSWVATYQRCCAGFVPPGSPSPCPPGYNPTSASYTYPDGHSASCPV